MLSPPAALDLAGGSHFILLLQGNFGLQALQRKVQFLASPKLPFGFSSRRGYLSSLILLCSVHTQTFAFQFQLSYPFLISPSETKAQILPAHRSGRRMLWKEVPLCDTGRESLCCRSGAGLLSYGQPESCKELPQTKGHLPKARASVQKLSPSVIRPGLHSSMAPSGMYCLWLSAGALH